MDYVQASWTALIFKGANMKDNKTRNGELIKEIHKLYLEKNAKYGNSFADAIKSWGYVAAGTQIEHKFNRIKQMIKTGCIFGEGEEETLRDNLRDIALYCLITIMVLDEELEELKVGAAAEEK
jgi:hypothetical protein